jgi:hypothetical protein
MTVTGIDQPVAISMDRDVNNTSEYRINFGAWQYGPSTVNPGDTVYVEMLSSPNFSTQVTCTLHVGVEYADFSITTKMDDTPQ